MVTVVQTDAHTLAVIAGLQTIGRPVGDAVRPPGGEPPYMFVTPFGGTRAGPVDDPDADASLTWQITCVGRDRTGAEWLADQAAEVMQTFPFAISGRAVVRRESLSDQPTQVDRDVTPPLFYSTPIWRLTTTPA